MRLSKDKTSWKAGGIIRRDFRNVKGEPEIEKPQNQRKTKKWCKGKPGVLHIKKWVKTKSANKTYHYKCQECGKIFDIWFKADWFCKPKPKGILE